MFRPFDYASDESPFTSRAEPAVPLGEPGTEVGSNVGALSPGLAALIGTGSGGGSGGMLGSILGGGEPFIGQSRDPGAGSPAAFVGDEHVDYAPRTAEPENQVLEFLKSTAIDLVAGTGGDAATELATRALGGGAGAVVGALLSGLNLFTSGMDVGKGIGEIAEGSLKGVQSGVGDLASGLAGVLGVVAPGGMVATAGGAAGAGPLGLAFGAGFSGTNYLLDHGLGDTLFGLEGSKTPHTYDVKQDVVDENGAALDRARANGGVSRQDPTDFNKQIVAYPDGHEETLEMKQEYGSARELTMGEIVANAAQAALAKPAVPTAE